MRKINNRGLRKLGHDKKTETTGGYGSFMLHVPLHITKVIDVGGVSLWVSSVCWDTK